MQQGQLILILLHALPFTMYKIYLLLALLLKLLVTH
jgi:hypothetical protein